MRTRKAAFSVAGAAGAVALGRLARRSGVQTADIARSLPGDELIRDPFLVVDRAVVLDTPVSEVWPWLVQLGKGRGGWYLPAWLERMVVRQAENRAATAVVPGLQMLAAGDEVADWGPGTPSFRVITVDPPHAIVYLSLRDRTHGWRWPSSNDPEAPGVMAFSWVLLLDDLGEGRSRLHIRLRARRARRRFSRLFALVGGLGDYLTVAAMFAGLEERLGA